MARDNAHHYDITSLQNPQVKEDRRLRDRRHRDRSGLMSIEGFAEFRLAWAAGIEIRRLYLCPDFLKPEERSLVDDLRSAGVPLVSVAPGIMEKLSYRDHPDGWFCVASQPGQRLTDFPEPGGRGLYLVAEDLEKPGNLGAILRSADAAGAAGVIVSDGRTDLSNPNVVRASKGVNFSVPCAAASNEEAANWLSARSIPVAVADPAGEDDLWTIDLPNPLAVVLGAEHEGISGFWRERADIRINIPMEGRVNSINVAQAATIIMYEIMRRRRTG
jgi:TrmH family RNA methyltransferase